MTILFVCTGNTCRSPMAEGLLRAELKRRGISASVMSAGLMADGQAAANHAVTVLAEWDIDLTRHRSRSLTKEMTDHADLVVVMTDEHRRLLCAAGVPDNKVFVPDGGIPDPYGGDLSVYRRTRDVLQQVVCQLADRVEGV